MKKFSLRLTAIIGIVLLWGSIVGCETRIDYTLNEDGVMDTKEREKLAQKIVDEYCEQNGIASRYECYMSDVHYLENGELAYLYTFNLEGAYTGDTRGDLRAIVSADGSQAYMAEE